MHAYRSHKENVPDYRFSQAMAEGLQSPLRQSLFKYALLCFCQLHASSCSLDHQLIWLRCSCGRYVVHAIEGDAPAVTCA